MHQSTRASETGALPLGGAIAGQVVRVVIAQLQEALYPGAAVIRTLAFQAVRQHQHQARLLLPPLLSCNDHFELQAPVLLYLCLLSLKGSGGTEC